MLINASYCFKMEDGELVFGGPNGINAFFPEEIMNNQIAPRVIITDLKIFNRSVKHGINSVLKKTIEQTDTIILNYKQYMFSFDFIALNYTLPDKNQFAYR